jgi:hypothetical protein
MLNTILIIALLWVGGFSVVLFGWALFKALELLERL